MQSLRGQLLIASPQLFDPNFRRTVVLLTHHDKEGAMGLVLSRPSEVRVADALPELALLAGTDPAVHVGGPVSPEALVVLVDHERPPVSAIVGNVAFMESGSEIGALDAVRARVFAGYSGWGPGQLEGELEESAWIVVDA